MRRTVLAAGGLAVLVAGVSAGCGGKSTSGGAGPTTTTPTSTTSTPTGSDSAAFLTARADPLDVRAAPDPSRAVTKTVSAAGGRLTASDANGNTFVFTVPPRAVRAATAITMTPVRSMAGMPRSARLVGAVQFAPDGLAFSRAAFLTITPAHAVPPGRQVLFGYRANGQDLHLALRGPAADRIQVAVLHFTGFGLASGSREALLVRHAADSEARLTQEVQQLIDSNVHVETLPDGRAARSCDDACGRTINDGLDSRFQAYYGLVLRPLMVAAQGSCATAATATEKVSSYLRMMQFARGGDVSGHNVLADFETIVQQGFDRCEKEAIKACQAAHDPSILVSAVLTAQRMRQLLGTGAPEESQSALVVRALTVCRAAFTVNEPFTTGTRITGRICSLAEPFRLTVSGKEDLGFRFAPSSAIEGDYSDRGNVPGYSISFKGGGHYTVSIFDEKGAAMSLLRLNLVDSGEATVASGGNQYARKASFRLTPLPRGC